MSDFSERDRQLLRRFGMTEEQVEADAERMESETADHGITGPVYHGLHMMPDHGERMVSVTVKMPASQLERITASAKRYHISRSEYMRRRLADA
ncbi:CopG family transcriptional regulator [Bifidobacterium margollesii]|uniref:CopG family transcriptional regulator n=1 Tax=Bifidobacterium margollesii TaxID=2020964 RepID=A0A2N5J6T5_9BIFI|nr:ribbon-helix-helix protein, CopG family [Bifidobacterium margollesii]PLS29897.1 CopG family transcriptional regulator [Bifidobacterium margollesii]